MRSRLPAALTFVLLLAAAPAQAQEPEEPQEDPYYVRVDVHPADAPGDYDPGQDCTGSKDTAGFSEGTLRLENVRPPVNAVGGPSLEPTAPECVVLATEGAAPCMPTVCFATPVGARAAYNVSSGEYAFVLLAPPLREGASWSGVSGNTGLGIRFDCEGCPPPGG